MTISSPFTEESVDAPDVSRGSKTLEFLGGLALGFAPILLLIGHVWVVEPILFDFHEIRYRLRLLPVFLLAISLIVAIGGSGFAFVKRKNAMGAGILVGFFGGFVLGFVLVMLFLFLALSAIP